MFVFAGMPDADTVQLVVSFPVAQTTVGDDKPRLMIGSAKVEKVNNKSTIKQVQYNEEILFINQYFKALKDTKNLWQIW